MILTSQFHYLDIFKNIQNFLVLVSRGLRLIAMNMHYVKCTLLTPKLQILAKTLPHKIPPFIDYTCEYSIDVL